MDNWKVLIENSEKVITCLIYALGDAKVDLHFSIDSLDCQTVFNVYKLNKRGDLKDIEINYIFTLNESEKNFKDFWTSLINNHLARAFLQDFIKEMKQRIQKKHGMPYDQLDIENLSTMLSESSFLTFRAIDVLEKNEIEVDPNSESGANMGPQEEPDDLIPPPKIKQGKQRKKELDEFKKAQVDAAEKAAQKKKQPPPPTGIEANPSEKNFNEGDTEEMKEERKHTKEGKESKVEKEANENEEGEESEEEEGEQQPGSGGGQGQSQSKGKGQDKGQGKGKGKSEDEGEEGEESEEGEGEPGAGKGQGKGQGKGKSEDEGEEGEESEEGEEQPGAGKGQGKGQGKGKGKSEGEGEEGEESEEGEGEPGAGKGQGKGQGKGKGKSEGEGEEGEESEEGEEQPGKGQNKDSSGKSQADSQGSKGQGGSEGSQSVVDLPPEEQELDRPTTKSEEKIDIDSLISKNKEGFDEIYQQMQEYLKQQEETKTQSGEQEEETPSVPLKETSNEPPRDIRMLESIPVPSQSGEILDTIKKLGYKILHQAEDGDEIEILAENAAGKDVHLIYDQNAKSLRRTSAGKASEVIVDMKSLL